MIRLGERAWVTLLLGGFVFIILLQTISLSPVSRLVPMAILLPTLALFAAQFALDLKGREREVPSPNLSADAWLKLAGWLLSLLVGITVLGLFLSLPLFLFLYLRIRAREGWLLALTLALATLLLEYCLFSLINIPLLRGWIWESIR
jgi:hypothetical protein